MIPRNSFTIQTSLKNLLKLFEEEAILENFELDDTWHPLSGFVDETIFKPNPTVKTILRHDYDFRGLVHFSAKIGSVKIKMNNPAREEKTRDAGKTVAPKYYFDLSGPLKTMIQLEHLLIEINVYEPGKYIVR